MADDLNYELNIETGDSDKQVKALASAINDLSDNLRDISRTATQAANAAEKIERQFTRSGKAAASEAEGIKKSNAARREQLKIMQELGRSGGMGPKLETGTGPGSAKDVANRFIASGLVAAQAEAEAIKKTNAARREQLKLMQEIRRAGGMGPRLETGTHLGSAQEVGSRFIASGLIFRQEAEAQAAGLEKVRQGNLAAAKAEMEHMNRLTNLRYSLYDVQRSFLVVGAGALALGGIIIKSAMDYETAMAQIARTSGIGGDALGRVREQFVELARTVPTAFSNLAEIGTLGGQLNIPSERLADFTRTVAMFTATTNVAVEQSATAFGRLDALLPDVQGNYEALGSSILNVGINSVATETEIVNTTNQIAAAGQQAGFAADQIIGLAASYASLGVAPEAARGTTIRFFSKISTAIAKGGEDLDRFAAMSGKTSEQFVQDWEANAGNAFVDLLGGMQQVQASGQNLEMILRSLGITAVRDINALLKLSQNAEIVSSSFGYAADGFDQTTQLASAFAVQAATLASQLQMLINAIQGFFAELGQKSVPLLAGIVHGLTEFIGLLTELASNPGIQTAGVIAGVFTTLVGVTSLLGFAMTRLVSATIAVRTSLATMKAEALAATGGFTGLTAMSKGLTGALLGTSAAAKILRGALISTGIGAAFVAVGFAVDAVTTAVDRLKPAAEQAKAAYGDVSTLTSALKKDTAELGQNADGVSYVTGEITKNRQQTAEWARDLKNATGSQADLGEAAQTTTTKIVEQRLAIGDHAKAVLADMIATNGHIQELFKLTAKLGKQDPQFNQKGFIKAIVENDVEGARKIIDDFYLEIEARDPIGFNADWTNIERNATDGLNELIGALELAATETEITKQVYQELGVTTADTAAQQNILAEEVADVADAMSVLRQAVEGAFASTNAIAAMSQDFYNLAQGVYESGTAFDAFSQTGISNLGNFQSAIVTIIAAGETMGLSSAQSVAVLFTQLQRMGVDTANLLASVANIPGLSQSSVLSAMKNMTPVASRLSDALGGISDSAKKAATNLGGRGRGGTSGAARAAAKEIRTLTDYARDLSSVFQRSFELRFSSQSATDKITTTWSGIAEATAEALQNIKEIQATMAKLSSDKAINQYFLSVAEMYGDSLRAGEIRGDLAEIDSKMAAEQKKLAKEQNKTNKSLEGNSEAAIDNRKTITDLVSSYQDLIESYASSGLDQQQLAIKTAQLKQQFVAQASQLGYNTNEIQKYAASFDDMTIAIGRVPRNITVSANINPALQALAEFEAQAKKSASSVGDSLRNSFGGIGTNAGGVGWSIGSDIGNAISAAMDNALTKHKIKVSALGAAHLNFIQTPNGLQLQEGNIGNLRFFQSGGYTGNGGISKASGIVHGKEFVVNAENTEKFRPILEAMNRGQMPVMAPSGMPNMVVVELSAYDRALLAAAGNVQLNIDGRAVARASNSANLVAANRGSN